MSIAIQDPLDDSRLRTLRISGRGYLLAATMLELLCQVRDGQIEALVAVEMGEVLMDDYLADTIEMTP